MSRKLLDIFFPPSNKWKLPTLAVHGDLHVSVPGGLCHHLERGAIPESSEISGKQAAATRVGLGKEAKHGGF